MPADNAMSIPSATTAERDGWGVPERQYAPGLPALTLAPAIAAPVSEPPFDARAHIHRFDAARAAIIDYATHEIASAVPEKYVAEGVTQFLGSILATLATGGEFTVALQVRDLRQIVAKAADMEAAQ